jgi:hypothetical protein
MPDRMTQPAAADALYESIGFIPERTFITYRKLLNASA